MFPYTHLVPFLATKQQFPSLSLSPSVSQEGESDSPNSFNPSHSTFLILCNKLHNLSATSNKNLTQVEEK